MSVSVVLGINDPVAISLIKLLGCPKNVKSFKYETAVGQITTVTVEYFPDLNDPDVQELEAVVEKFQLVRIEPWPFAEEINYTPMTRDSLEQARIDRDLRITNGAPHGTEWAG